MGERFTLWVVREGTERGKGRYSDGEYFTDFFRQCDAARFTKARAFEVAGTTGRPVRLVTLSEQLRRARKRIAELESKQACMTDKAVQIMTEDRDKYYQRGRADERAAVVGWLRKEVGAYHRIGHRTAAIVVDERANEIESGEHVKGGG